MPGSLITSSSTGGHRSVVHRSDSNRSDKSDASAYSSEGGSSKKVSFNRAVRVKKYSTPPISPIDIPENKFWFKVYKTQQYKPQNSDSPSTQFDEPEEELNEASSLVNQNNNSQRPLSTIVESGDSISSSSSSPEMPRKPESSKTFLSQEKSKSRGTNIVEEDIEEMRHRHCGANTPSHLSVTSKDDRNYVPEEPEIDYMTVNSQRRLEASKPSSPKRNPIVNGVKVIFGMSPSIPKKGKNDNSKLEHVKPLRESVQTSDSAPERSFRSDQSKSKINLYSPPSRNANLPLNYKLHNNGIKPDNSDMNEKIGKKSYHQYGDRSSDTIKNQRDYKLTHSKHENPNGSGLELVVRPDSDEEHHPQNANKVRIIPNETWESGPMLIADRSDFQKSLAEMPGEGKIFSTREEGSQIWKTKTRRKYHEIIPKELKENRRTNAKIADDIPRDMKAIEYDGKKHTSRKTITTATDDEKIVSANELDDMLLEKTPKSNSPSDTFMYSYVPMVRDVGIQCNRKKTNKHLIKSTNNVDTSFRVIKSSNNGFVSAYSDVPSLKAESPIPQTPVLKHEIWNMKNPPSESRHQKNEAIYSQIDKTKKKYKTNDDDYIRDEFETTPKYNTLGYYSPQSQLRSLPDLSAKDLTSKDLRPSSPTRYQDSVLSSNTTIKNKTKGFGFKFSTGVDGPEVKLPRTPTLKRSEKTKSSYNYDMTDELPETYTNTSERNTNRNGYKREVNEEVIEETISISNASSDDMIQNQNTDIDEILAPKSVIREIDHKRKEISYENVSPSQRQLTGRGAYDGATTNGGGIWYRDLDEDYRRGMSQNEVSFPSGNEPSFSTLSRVENKSKKSNREYRDFSPPPRQAFTLDRKHLADRKKRMDASGPRLMLNGEPIKEHPERFSRSDANLTRSVDHADVYRGGLAAAYRTRQGPRASSLNRVVVPRADRSPSYPRRYLKTGHLGSAGNSAQSSSDSDTAHRKKAHLQSHHQYVHDRDPIVMYIPAVSHHDKRADEEPDRLSGILRTHSISSSKRPTKPKKGSKMTSASSDIGPSKHRPANSYIATKPIRDREELDEIVELRDTKEYGKDKGKKRGLNRRHSIPKDTKFPWLQKLKFKVKSKDS